MCEESRQNFKYLENEKSFYSEIKNIFRYFLNLLNLLNLYLFLLDGLDAVVKYSESFAKQAKKSPRSLRDRLQISLVILSKFKRIN